MSFELEKFKGRKLTGFFYDRQKRVVLMNLGRDVLYIDLTHPFSSFFPLGREDLFLLPLNFEKKNVGFVGFKLSKTRLLEGDRVLYLLFRKRTDLRIVVVEITGRASFLLIVDENGKVKFKYPPHRKRRKGGDVGQEYNPPEKKPHYLLDKYFGAHLGALGAEDFVSLFLKSSEFYHNGEVILPFQKEGFVSCDTFTKCFLKLYKKVRFSNMMLKEVKDRQIPYSVYFKAAALLKGGKLKHEASIGLDGYTLSVPDGVKGDALVEFLLKMGSVLKRLQKKNSIVMRETGSFMRFKSPSGFRVLVGRSANENNRLTFNIAKGNDLFFHVRGLPGAHIILMSRGSEVKKEDILFCAKLAKRFSRAKKENKIDVSYTEVKFLRPVKGQPGKVILTKEKTVII